jgi:hypothetical protein
MGSLNVFEVCEFCPWARSNGLRFLPVIGRDLRVWSAGQVAHQRLVDRRAVEDEVLDLLVEGGL